MTSRIPTLLLTALAALSGAASAADCPPAGSAQFICGPRNAEDLAPLPGSGWVIAAGMTDAKHPQGRLYLVNARDHAWAGAWPDKPLQQPDPAYRDCAAPDQAVFAPHGLSLREGKNGHHTLYAVNHGGRESIVVFAVDASGAKPTLTWQGCVVLPKGASANSVAALPEGGFALTHFADMTDPKLGEKLRGGVNTGYVLEWHPTRGWHKLEGSDMSAPNGNATSADGKYLFVGGWAGKSVVRFERGSKAAPRSVATGFLTDNVKLASDGSVLAAGQNAAVDAIMSCVNAPDGDACKPGTSAVKIDPNSFAVTPLFKYDNAAFANGTVAVEVGDEWWVGTFAGDRIARFKQAAPAR